MAEKYLFFNSTQGDMREYQANDIADYWNSFLSTGLISDNGEPQLKVVAEGTNRIIEIQKGRALIDGHLYLNDSTKLKIEEPDALYDRIDRVVIRYDNTIKNRFIKAFVLKGETSENPVPPQLTRGGDIYELSLAQIRVVGGKSFIEQKDIVDERLNEDVCGLASSLVSVPTSIFDESFKEYMDKIAMEWQDWYNGIESDTYVTNTQFDAYNRQVDRQLANLNAIADIDERAIGNTGKFYDLFDGTNNNSVAALDNNRTIITDNLNIGDVDLFVENSTGFEVNQEITIYYLNENESDYVKDYRIITAIEGKKLTINKPFEVEIKIYSLILRSNVLNGEITNGIEFVNWASYRNNGIATTGTISGRTEYEGSFSEDGNFYYPGTGSVIFKYNDTSNIYEPHITISDLSTWGRAKIHPSGKIVLKMNNVSSSVKFSVFELDHENKTYTTLMSTTYANNSQDYPDCFEYFTYAGVEYIAIILSYAQADFHFRYRLPGETSFSAVIKEGYLTNGRFVTYLKDGFFLIGSQSVTQLCKVSLDSFSVITTINVGGWRAFPHPFKNLILITKENTSALPISVKWTETSLVTNTLNFDISPVNTTQKSTAWWTEDGNFLIIGAGVKKIYRFSGEGTFTLAKEISEAFTSMAVCPKKKLAIIIGTDTSGKMLLASYPFSLQELELRYNFKNPVKNLAGWLFAKETPTTVKAELSLVDVNENEDYKELNVTQNENEYEFLETENLYLKDKATLKLTIEGGSLDKLLGGIE